jgi:hypothetical protein
MVRMASNATHMKTTQSYYRCYNILIGWGLENFEAREIAGNYWMPQIRSLPYLQSMIKSRRLYVSNLSKRNYTPEDIREKIYALYATNDCLTDGKPDVWKMIRRYRKIAIADNDYLPPKRKGSHHGGGISKGQVADQKKRRKAKTNLEKYDEGRGRG